MIHIIDHVQMIQIGIMVVVQNPGRAHVQGLILIDGVGVVFRLNAEVVTWIAGIVSDPVPFMVPFGGGHIAVLPHLGRAVGIKDGRFPRFKLGHLPHQS